MVVVFDECSIYGGWVVVVLTVIFFVHGVASIFCLAYKAIIGEFKLLISYLLFLFVSVRRWRDYELFFEDIVNHLNENEVSYSIIFEVYHYEMQK